MNLTHLTIHEAAALLARHELSPVDLTRAYLERIERINPSLNYYITITADLAMHNARRAEGELQAGVRRGYLHGIPLALKDLYETAGVRTTHGSTFFAGYVPEIDGQVVSNLKDAGMVLLGKTNMHEIALGVTNVNPHYGPSRNPWNAERITGGSSGGSAGAVSAGLCMAALGSDTGGSIRIPASLCGVVGLKPTYGRISLQGVIPLSWNLDHAGPMTRCVRDAAILMGALSGYDAEDPGSSDVPVDDYLAHLEEGVKHWRFALAADEFFSKVDPQVDAAIQHAVVVLSQLGAKVKSVEFPEGYNAAATNVAMVTSDAAAFHQKRLEETPEGFGEDVRQRLESGARRTSSEYALARREQTRLRRLYERFFDGYDILITPSTPVTAPSIQGPDAVEQAKLLTRFTAPFNLTGLPAISLPCGFDSDGLPVGIQLVAKPWAEAALLRAAYAYEKAAGWYQQQPNLIT